MPFVNSAGEVQDTRSWFRVGAIFELFWAIVNFFGLFFNTIFGDARAKVKANSNIASRAQGPTNRRGGGGGGPYIRGFKDLNKGGGAVPGGCGGGGCGM